MSDPATGLRLERELVTAFLKDGRSVTGVVDDFSPGADAIRLTSEADGPERIATPALAYLAVHAREGDAPPDLGPGATALKVHLRTGASLAVLAAAGRHLGRGFRAIPRTEGRYREYYFFADAVRLRERDEPIGSMLVSSGAVHPEVLEHAIAAQQAHQNTPIGKLLVDSLSVSESDLARAVSLQKQKNNRIGDLLVEEGLATAEQVDRALAEQRRRKTKRIGEVLLDLDIVSEETLARTLASKFDLRYVDLDRNPPEPAALAELARDVVARHFVLPIQKTETKLVLAIADPLSLDRLADLGLSGDRILEEVVVAPSALKRRIDELLAETPKAVEGSEFDFVLEGLGDSLSTPEAALRQTPMPRSLSSRAPRSAPLDPAWLPDVGEDAPLQALLTEALRAGARVVHIEPRAGAPDVPVRLRAGGKLVGAASLPAEAREAVVLRVKQLAHLDADERRRPQTGKLRIRLGARELEYRLTTLPTLGGFEDVVLHALEPRRFLPLTELGLAAPALGELERWLARPSGLVLCVGPADSGKTTTVHALLARLSGPDTVVGTVESPVEIVQPALRQVQVEPGFGFFEGLQALLLADTDVIFVGALSDARTASAAVEASLGERRVFSTIAARDAGCAVARLLELGVDAPLLARALVGVVNQRLVRRLCHVCRERVAVTSEQERALAGAIEHSGASHYSYRARGCAACGDTGYLGFVALHELASVDEEVRGLITRRAPSSELVRALLARGRSLIDDGARKAADGEAALDDVLRACS